MDDHFADLGFDDIAEQYWGKARRKTCEDVGKLDPALSVGRRADSALSLEAHQSYWGHDEGFILSHMNVVGQATGRARNKRASATTTTSCKCDICCNNKWKPKISHSSFGRSDQTPRHSTVTLDSYKVKDELDLEIVDSNKTSGQAKTYLKVKVLKLLGTPWRSGCVMLCECLESPKAFQVGKHYVLKIVDHRLLQNMALNGTADEFLNSSFPLASLSHDKEFELHAHTYEPWQAEAGFHRICEVMVQEEMVAYHHLKHLQGTYIPDLIYEIRTCPWFAKLGETPFEHYFQSPGFLLECVDGVALNEISKVPRFFWEEIYQEAVRTANILAYYGFDHKSLAPRNLIVKHQRAPNGRVRVVFIDLHKHGLWSEEDGYFKYDIRWHNDMEEGLFWRSECGDSNPNEEDISRVQWYRKMWHQRIFTGRFGEKSLFNYPEKWEREEDGREPDADTIRNCIKYRIIMDDLWHIEDKTLIDTMVHVKGQVSRIAAEIIEEEVERPGLFYEADRWHERAIALIAERFHYETDGIMNRFKEAFDAYYQRPNGPPPFVVETFSDAFLAGELHGAEEVVSLRSSRDSALPSRTRALTSATSSDRSPSIVSSCSSSSASLYSTSTAASSVSNLAVMEVQKPQTRLRIFISKPVTIDQVEELEDNFGWL